MSEIAGLIERVKAATGPSHELDMDIALAMLAVAEPSRRFAQTNYTSSIDAALSLAERVLPGWRVSSMWTADPTASVNAAMSKCGADLTPYLTNDDGWKTGTRQGVAETLPLAILLALLTALESESPQ